MLRRMSSLELTEWAAYFHLENDEALAKQQAVEAGKREELKAALMAEARQPARGPSKRGPRSER